MTEKITRTMVDDDINMVLDSLKSHDYVIPSTREILAPLFGYLKWFYLFQFCWMVLAVFIHKTRYLEYILVGCIPVVIGCMVATFVAVSFFYTPLMINLCLEEKVKRKSILYRVVMALLEKYIRFGVIAILVVSVFFMFNNDWGFLAPSGALTVAIFVGAGAGQMSLSRYLTPSVIEGIAKIKQVISGSSV